MHDAEKIFIPDFSDQNTTIISSSNSSQNYNSKININTADESMLQELPGVGPSLAQKIITYREKNGKFSSIDDLKNVTGIGDKKFESLKDYIST